MKQFLPKKEDWPLLFLGLGTYLHVRLIGYMSLAEIALLLLLPFLLIKNFRRMEHKVLRRFLVLWFLWLISAAASEYFTGNQLDFAARGMARVFFLGVALFSLYFYFVDRPRSIQWYLLGAAISAIASNYVLRQGGVAIADEIGIELTPSFESLYNYWIAGFWMWILVAYFWRANWFWGLFGVGLGITFVLLGSRSSGLIIVVSSVLSVILATVARMTKRVSLTLPQFVMAGFIALLAAGGVAFMYKAAAESGRLKEKDLQKYETQTNSQLGMVLGGRPEVLACMLAIKDSPIVGHGTWALDKDDYMGQAIELLGFRRAQDDRPSMAKFIPAHSMLFGSWMEQGLFGGVFWIVLLGYLVYFVRWYIIAHPPLIPIGCYLVCNLSWAILFSPIGFRVLAGAQIALLLAVVTIHRRTVQMEQRRLQEQAHAEMMQS